MLRVFITCLVTLPLLAACERPEPSRPEEIRTVRVMQVGKQAVASSRELAGEVRARHEVPLSFRVGGKIIERRIDAGARVAPGQALARLDPGDLALAAAAARANVASIQTERDLAASEVKRYRDLRERNFISEAELERRESLYKTIQARLNAALAQEEQAANQSRYANLIAETAGVVIAVEAEVGQVVAAGQTVARIALPGAKEVLVAVPESQRREFEQARTYILSASALPGRSWPGRLRELSPAADPVTRTYAARITVTGPDADLALGMSASVKIETRARAGAGGADITVPISAIQSRSEQPQVWLVDKGDTVRAQTVVTRGFVGEQMLIESGLQAGDRVVIAGGQLLRPGQKIRVHDAPPPPVTP